VSGRGYVEEAQGGLLRRLARREAAMSELTPKLAGDFNWDGFPPLRIKAMVKFMIHCLCDAFQCVTYVVTCRWNIEINGFVIEFHNNACLNHAIISNVLVDLFDSDDFPVPIPDPEAAAETTTTARAGLAHALAPIGRHMTAQRSRTHGRPS
jgi:hypothetical protein